MPTVLREDGFEIMIHTADHAPPHVHVWKAGELLKVNLGGEDDAPSIRENVSMKRQEARKGVRLVEDNQVFLLERWREVHG